MSMFLLYVFHDEQNNSLTQDKLLEGYPEKLKPAENKKEVVEVKMDAVKKSLTFSGTTLTIHCTRTLLKHGITWSLSHCTSLRIEE
jgi:hypothetical protein